MSLSSFLKSCIPKPSQEQAAYESEVAQVIAGPWDGHEIKRGQPGQRIPLPHRPDCLHCGSVLAVYVFRDGAWRFCGFMQSQECKGK